MSHQYNTDHEYRIMTLYRVNELIYIFTTLYRQLDSRLYPILDCVASTGLALETFPLICHISDFPATQTAVTTESIESSDDDWDQDDDDLIDDDDDDDDDGSEPGDDDLEDEDQDDLDDDDDEIS